MRIYRSSTIHIPQDQNLTELLHTTARPLPESHLIAKDSLTNRSITLGELRDRAGRIAKGISEEYNPQDGSRFAIILPNSVEYIEVFHAVLWCSGVGCPINYALKATEIAHALAVSRPQFIIAYGDVVSKVREAIDLAAKDLSSEGISWQAPVVISVITRAPSVPHIPEDFIRPTRLFIPHYSDTSKRLASIHLSSGTTGKPKGVELTHYNFVANCYQLFAHDPDQFHASSRTVAFTPFAHIAMTTMPLWLGELLSLYLYLDIPGPRCLTCCLTCHNLLQLC